MYIIAGLGNPTKEYENTRHNAGFCVIDTLAEKHGIGLTETKHKALYGSGYIEGQKVLLVKPMTFMNLSGEAIQLLVNYYKIDPEEELIVIYDDISLAPGQLRIRKKGSAGGHNGIKNIIARLDTQVFKRIKVGVGEKPKGWDLADFVLGHFYGAEMEDMKQGYADAADAVSYIVRDDIDGAMNIYNQRK